MIDIHDELKSDMKADMNSELKMAWKCVVLGMTVVTFLTILGLVCYYLPLNEKDRLYLEMQVNQWQSEAIQYGYGRMVDKKFQWVPPAPSTPVPPTSADPGITAKPEAE